MRAAAAIAVLFAALAADGAEWPEFRGDPAQTGHVAALADRYVVAWRAKVGSPVKSTPTIANGLVFVGSEDGQVRALDLATGRPRWSFATGGPVQAAPLVVDGRVFVGSSDHRFYALDAASGALAWQAETGDKVLGSATTAVEGARRLVLVGSYDHRLYAFDAATGKTVWSFETGNYVHATPAMSDGMAVFGGCDAKLHVVGLDDGKSLGALPLGAYTAASPAIADGRAYVGNWSGGFVAVDLDELVVKWTFKPNAFPIYASAAISGDRLVVGGRDRFVHLLDRASGKEIAHFDAGAKVDASPIADDERALVMSVDGRLSVLSLKDAKKRWSWDLGGAVAGSPAVAGEYVVVGLDTGRVVALKRAP